LKHKIEERATKAVEKKAACNKKIFKKNINTKIKNKLKYQNKNKLFAPANKNPSLIVDEVPLDP